MPLDFSSALLFDVNFIACTHCILHNQYTLETFDSVNKHATQASTKNVVDLSKQAKINIKKDQYMSQKQVCGQTNSSSRVFRKIHHANHQLNH